MNTPLQNQWFSKARYGLFIHYGLYSVLSRGEWAWNREGIPFEDYKSLRERFSPDQFNADQICAFAKEMGMRYVVLTTMHHEGFRLYPTQLSDFHIGESPAKGRDLVEELVVAARKHGLKVGLYHSLNNWYDQPDAVSALENPKAYSKFMEATHARIRELVERYNPIDILWYDGWWPFNAEGWKGEEMNEMVRKIQPHILFNGRNGLPGDFATPEGHLAAPKPWRPWEACMTLNNSWGYHEGDQEWKTAGQLIDYLITCAQGNGNLLINIGPQGSGAIPSGSMEVLTQVGNWLKKNGESIYETEVFTLDLQEKGEHRGEWLHHGPFTAKEKNLYWHVRRWPGGSTLAFDGLECKVLEASLLGSGTPLKFTQVGGRVQFTGLPEQAPDELCSVIRMTCDGSPSIYLTGGMRIPSVSHPHYDPCPSDIAH
ncbi:MAG: alpha-L-fucosidase [Verrucomicrobiota bacterium]